LIDKANSLLETRDSFYLFQLSRSLYRLCGSGKDINFYRVANFSFTMLIMFVSCIVYVDMWKEFYCSLFLS